MSIFNLINSLKENTTLENLNLSYNSISNHYASLLFSSIREHPTIKSLIFRGFNGSIEEIASALKENTVLTSLDIRGNNITDKGAKKIASALEENTTLTSLNIKNDKISIDVLKTIEKHLERNKKLAEQKEPVNSEQKQEEKVKQLEQVLEQEKLARQKAEERLKELEKKESRRLEKKAEKQEEKPSSKLEIKKEQTSQLTKSNSSDSLDFF